MAKKEAYKDLNAAKPEKKKKRDEKAVIVNHEYDDESDLSGFDIDKSVAQNITLKSFKIEPTPTPNKQTALPPIIEEPQKEKTSKEKFYQEADKEAQHMAYKINNHNPEWQFENHDERVRNFWSLNQKKKQDKEQIEKELRELEEIRLQKLK